MLAERKHIVGKTPAVIAVLVLAALTLASFASVAQALPKSFWGVDPQASPTEAQFQRLKRGGVQSVRIPLSWSGIEPGSPGTPEWGGTDDLVRGAALAGLEVLPYVTGAPGWAVPEVWVPGSHQTVKTPTHLPVSGAAAGAWSSFLGQAVARYGPGGDFWAQNPGLAERPVRTWQIWNEPNFKYFVAKPNPAEYGKLVKLSYGAVKTVDPGAKVVLAGMFARPKGSRTPAGKHKSLNYYASDFLAEMYRRNPGIKSKFSGVALHPYTGKYQELTPEIEEFRKVLADNRDSGKGLWITELGWSSKPLAPLTNIFAKGIKGQAQQLQGAFALLRSKQVKWRVQRVYWFSVDDQVGSCNFCDGSGLFGEGFVPKKAWYMYVKFAGGEA
jgi:hypothetical protein